MDPSKHLNQFARSQAAAPRARSPVPTHQQHVQPPSRPQPVGLQHHHPQASLQQVVQQLRGVQLHDNMHTPVTPGSEPPLSNGSFSPASGMSHLSPPMGTQGLQSHGLMPIMMGMPPYFPVPGQAMSGQQLRTPHSWQQQQFSPPLPGNFQSSGQEPSQSSSVDQQPIQQGVLQSHYPHHPPVMPQWQQQPAVKLQQQFRELNVANLPDPIQVMMKDERDRSGSFVTSAKGLLPPMVTTNYVAQDQGNASPRYIRSSLYSVPESQDMLNKSAVPLSLVITPFARLEEGEFAPPVADCRNNGPVRCGQCQVYMCSFMKFFESGWKFTCPFCQSVTEVPREYFQHLDHTGMRKDKFQKPELCLGTYEFVVSEKYCREDILPKPPAVMFVLDVSYSSVKSGLVRLVCRNMKTILASLPREFPDGPLPKVGFITYNDQVQFYRISPSLTEPQMKIVGDLEDMFVPMMNGYLEDPEEASDVIDLLMERIQKSFANTQETETILGPAINAGLKALELANCSGKLLVFNSSLPVNEAPGRLMTKDEHKLLGTDREKTAFRPQTNYYDKLGKECAKSGVRVDLFLAHNGFIDLATIGQVARLTSGQIYKYTPCRVAPDGDQLMVDGELIVEDVKRNLERTCAFDVTLRVRTSLGVRPVNFYGNFFMSNTKEVELAGMDSDQAVTVELNHNGNFTDQDTLYIQVATLHTSVSGQRRIRVHNLSLNVSSSIENLYFYCDEDVVMNFLLKQSVSQVKDSTPMNTQKRIIERAAQILASYRRNCPSPSPVRDFKLPGSMPLLPLYVNSLLKCDALSGGQEMTVDDRVYHMITVMSMDVGATQRYLYSSVIPLLDPTHPQPTDGDVYLTPIRCTLGSLRDDGVYMIDNGISLFLWAGLLVDQDWIRCVFGVESAAHIDVSETRLMEFDNPQSRMVRAALAKVRGNRQKQMRLMIVRPRDKSEYFCCKLFAEDKNLFNNKSFSYDFFFRLLYKETEALLSEQRS